MDTQAQYINYERMVATMNGDAQTLFQSFLSCSITELKELLANASERDEMLFYQRMIALKLGLAQEKVVGEELL